LIPSINAADSAREPFIFQFPATSGRRAAIGPPEFAQKPEKRGRDVTDPRGRKQFPTALGQKRRGNQLNEGLTIEKVLNPTRFTGKHEEPRKGQRTRR